MMLIKIIAFVTRLMMIGVKEDKDEKKMIMAKMMITQWGLKNDNCDELK